MASPTPTGSGARPKAVSPARVARSFVKQYYGLLCNRPEEVHRFYKVDSHFTHGVGTEAVDVVIGKTAIAEKIRDLNLSEVSVDLENGGSVDYQASQDGGVLVMVLGYMAVGGQPKRPFMQTFFLAPQQNGECLRLLIVFCFCDGSTAVALLMWLFAWVRLLRPQRRLPFLG